MGTVLAAIMGVLMQLGRMAAAISVMISPTGKISMKVMRC